MSYFAIATAANAIAEANENAMTTDAPDVPNGLDAPGVTIETTSTSDTPQELVWPSNRVTKPAQHYGDDVPPVESRSKPKAPDDSVSLEMLAQALKKLSNRIKELGYKYESQGAYIENKTNASKNWNWPAVNRRRPSLTFVKIRRNSTFCRRLSPRILKGLTRLTETPARWQWLMSSK